MNKSKYNTSNRESMTCPFSDSCFTCPLSDCKIGSVYASKVNILPTELGFNRRLEEVKSQSEIQRKVNKRAKEVAERRGRHTTNNK